MDFHVTAIDTDGSETILAEFDNSGEAKEFLRQYTSKEDAGGWDLIQVLDTRGDCAEILWVWEREDA